MKGRNPKVGKYSQPIPLHILVKALFIVIFMGCEKNHSLPPGFDLDLLTSKVWGDEFICDLSSNPEIFSRIFEPEGNYSEYFKIYQRTGGTWRLKENNSLEFCGAEYEILSMTEDALEIQNGFCVSRFKALNITKAFTIGVTDLSQTSARLHGSVRTCYLTDVSFEYGISEAYGNVTNADFSPIKGPANALVHVSLLNLIPETVYHYRIKAVNSSGTNYGRDQTFSTFNTLTINDADNNNYNAITIGSQVWMAENLKTTKYNDGSGIPLLSDSTTWADLRTPGYCWYKNNSITFKNSYGAIYNWYAVNTGKICPSGWHVPDEQELITLKEYLGEEAGSKLTQGYYDLPDALIYTDPSANFDASNESSFSAIWAGTRGLDFSFNYCQLWSRTENDSQNAKFVNITNGFYWLMSVGKESGLPVRCLKN